MLTTLRGMIHSSNFEGEYNKNTQNDFLVSLDGELSDAFIKHRDDSLLLVHQMLYEINIAHLSVSWINKVENIHHPFVCEVKHRINEAWMRSLNNKYSKALSDLPSVKQFPQWIRDYVANHKSNELHPVFTYLRDEASLDQSKEFFFQETPLEMLFGDIVAMMMPGVYGGIKVELVKNFWDEVGRAVDEKSHRKLRARMMEKFGFPEDCYVNNTELFILEELQLINTYLSLALDRTQQVQLVGVMLATELMIPGRFQYLIDGWRRLGVSDFDLHYHIEHTSVDEVHADDLLDHIAIPILTQDENQMKDIILGAMRRLDAIVSVLDKSYERMLNNETSFQRVPNNAETQALACEA